jgi:hypothetical protein
MAAQTDPRVDEWLEAQPGAWRGTLAAARILLGEAFPAAREAIKWGVPTWVGHGNLASLMPYPDHVNLQFFQGTKLADPQGLLEGTGVAMRHVPVRHARDLQVPAVKGLLRSAWRLDRAGAPKPGRGGA